VSSTESFLSDPFTILILSLVLILSGLLLSLICIAFIRMDLQSRRWPTVEGKITASRTEREATGYDSNHHMSHAWVPEIRYGYEVGGMQFQGKRIGNSIYSSSWRGGAQRVAHRFPSGKAVSVHYNPADPSQAVLVTFTFSNVVGLVISLVVFAAGLVMLLRA
jgi:Protein of unknown function (DUF3592)